MHPHQNSYPRQLHAIAIIATAIGASASCVIPTDSPPPLAPQARGPSGASQAPGASVAQPTQPSSTQPAEPTAPVPTEPATEDPETLVLRQVEREMLAAANRLRADPPTYASELETFRSYYDGAYIDYPGRQVRVITNEGIAAADEAIRVARRASPARNLRWSEGLARAAREHAIEIGAAGHIEHRGADMRGPTDRMEKYGRVGGYSAENIGTGDTNGTDMINALFVDDGVANRGHRTILLTKAYTVVGIGCAPHSRYQRVCVMDFAELYDE